MQINKPFDNYVKKVADSEHNRAHFWAKKQSKWQEHPRWYVRPGAF